jgi:hypothetical protein
MAARWRIHGGLRVSEFRCNVNFFVSEGAHRESPGQVGNSGGVSARRRRDIAARARHPQPDKHRPDARG